MRELRFEPLSVIGKPARTARSSDWIGAALLSVGLLLLALLFTRDLALSHENRILKAAAQTQCLGDAHVENPASLPSPHP